MIYVEKERRCQYFCYSCRSNSCFFRKKSFLRREIQLSRFSSSSLIINSIRKKILRRENKKIRTKKFDCFCPSSIFRFHLHLRSTLKMNSNEMINIDEQQEQEQQQKIPEDLFSCLICYETFGFHPSQPLVVLKCGHLFCSHCIQQWLTLNKGRKDNRTSEGKGKGKRTVSVSPTSLSHLSKTLCTQGYSLH